MADISERFFKLKGDRERERRWAKRARYYLAAGHLMRDANASSDLNLGPELLSNGGFDDASGWTTGVGWSIGGGIASASGASAGLLSENLGLIDGAIYRVTVEVLSVSAGSVFVNLGGNFQSNITVPGSYGYTIPAGVANDQLRFGTNSFTGSIDNASVRAVL